MRLPVLLLLSLAGVVLVVAVGCAPRISLFGSGSDALAEFVLQGEAEDKVALIHVR